MKSFASILPLAGLALAQQQCEPQGTITKTEVQKVTITVSATSAVADTTAITSVRPTRRPHAHHSHYPAPHYPMPNGTYYNSSTLVSYTTPFPSTVPTLSFMLPTDTTGTSIQTLYVTPSPVDAPSESATDAAIVPASEATAAASSAAAAPAEATVPETSPAGTVNAQAATVSGKATSYGGNLAGGNCMFTGYTLPSGVFGTAFSGQNWDASKCGVCVSVTGPNGKPIKAMVCPASIRFTHTLPIEMLTHISRS